MKKTTRTLSTVATAGLLVLGLATPASAAEPVALPGTGPALAALSAHRAPAAPARRMSVTSAENDLNGDGIDDVLTRDRASTGIDLYTGTGGLNGTSTLAGPTRVRTATPNRVWFGQGDLNGDGRADIASIDGSGVMYAAYNQGTSTPSFAADVSFLSGFTPSSPVCLGDFVGSDPNNPLEPDGRADLVLKNPSTKAIDLYVNDGTVNGKPSYSYRGALLTGADYVTGIHLADLTGDYFKDILVTMTDGTLWLLDLFADVDSAGNPVAKWFRIIDSGMNAADHLLFPDFNQDDYPDFAARLTATGELRGVLHSGTWNPAAPATVFDSATGQLVRSGWTGYDWVF
ncbi:hypothetical protein FHX82_004905 [Amycolatopsis bartoniae]|uniref:VCBS repeat-containing protein n=1 Tax=Amycolatopsis bartoniae TaxID=941986 RepID=A0A8H9IW91_9PSEU|nr:VCBS repeat-containing protein [Amycolatopsis bartoniae]MBB2937829.1 hypothetical protein [Amycolatopsis bartoniae]TVT06507.1 VCBS repeat-containing protein [Amycolatopsis bartoniae]GHF41024.1 hypothetical protein GCM10017566_13070 [Amycolatopsis bartoniae]